MRLLICAAVAATLALAGCVPIPIAQKAYVPNPSDTTPRHGSGCAFNEARTTGDRKVGDATVSVSLSVEDKAGETARARLWLFVDRPASSKRVSVTASRIRLLDDGRTLTARPVSFEEKTVKNGTHSTAVLVFTSPSGMGEKLSLTFDPGAIRIGGRAIPFAPIRFEKKEGPAIYIFPCIPT
ncbi:hypothetical protein [Roseovarius aestuariivivens]|uniref:hypothetical protein n=1 Tax=Roseovarius aestuariivivens TaxID=1888910 RepID=UPI0010817635|nr:hypothetical protein [Roseovarius aestuariivivens]